MRSYALAAQGRFLLERIPMNDLIELDCPNCQQKLRVPVALAGKQVKCPACAAVIPVPGESGIASGLPAYARSPRTLADDDAERSHRSRDDDRYLDDIASKDGRYEGSGLTVMAICLLIVAIIGLCLDIFNVVVALVGSPPPIDQNEPAFIQEMKRSAFGPAAIVMQSAMAAIAMVVIAGAIQMLRRKTWGLGMAACILSMLHLGSCCCLFGLPLGIWGIVLLVDKNVKNSFS